MAQSLSQSPKEKKRRDCFMTARLTLSGMQQRKLAHSCEVGSYTGHAHDTRKGRRRHTFRLPCAYLWLSPPSGRSARRLRLPTIRFEQNPPAGWPSSSAAVLRSGRSVRCRRRTAGCSQSSTPLRSMATKAASVANWLIIVVVGVLPMSAAVADVRVALVHHDSGLRVWPVN